MIDHPLDGDGPDFLRKLRSDSATGHAALLLVESLIHHLISKKLLSVAEAIEIIDVATEIEREVGLAANDGMPPLVPPSSLVAMATSLRNDLAD